MRLAFYAGASTAAAAACLLKAFHQRPNFYSATVYLSQSNACLLILTNLVLVLVCSFIYALQRLLYGPLRPIEIEQLSEKAWYAVLDTLLAMPSFREDVGGWLLTMFVILLAGKVWGWIGEGRVDILEQQPPANPRLFHARLATSLVVSVAFDLFMLNYCVETVMADPRPGMMVIFTFEFAILSIFSAFTLSRYLLSVIETLIQQKQLQEAIEARKIEIRAERAALRQNQTDEGASSRETPAEDEPIDVDENEVDVPGWEDKRRYLFVLEVLTDFVKLMIYIVFFTVSVTFNGLPMHIMRDVYMTFASFSKRVTDFVAYRKATSDMNTRYPDATTEEIRGDACIVCRETMVAWDQSNASAQPPAANEPGAPDAPPAAAAANPPTPSPPARRDEGLRAKKLPCGHILHLRCLKAWLERQQVCPTCRRPVVSVSAETPAQPGRQNARQPGAGHPPRRHRRLNRARVFNLGPIRIGFLNGPGDQIQNIVNQMRNPQGQAQDPAAGPNEAGDQNGVNPSTLPQATSHSSTHHTTAHRSSISHYPASTYIQLMRIEQRLMQEAHNLNLQQQELVVLRQMEAEMARLRGLHNPILPPVGTSTEAQRRMAAAQGDRTQHVPNTQRFVGDPPSSMGHGHGDLPPGLVLPEGWSVMPLRATAAIGEANAGPSQATAAPSNQSLGPTDDNGSPLFVAATPQTSANGAGASPSPANGPSAIAPTPAAGEADETHTSTREEQPHGIDAARTVEVEEVPDNER